MAKKNIILVVIDCLRADFCFPDAPPFIEHLKNNGESYTQFISVATSTAPCFASLLTGLYPESHGIIGHPKGTKDITPDKYSLRKQVITLPMILKDEKYNTYAEVCEPLFEAFGLTRGFDCYNLRTQDISIFKPVFFDKLKELLNNLKVPYFFMLHLFELHQIIDYEKFERQCEKLEELLTDIDLKDTIIIITSDHGEGIEGKLGEDAKHGKHVLNYLVNVPLIIASNGIEKETFTKQYSQVDFLPIILEKLEFEKKFPYKLQGSTSPRKFTYVQAVGSSINKKNWLSGIRTQEYTYVIEKETEMPLGIFINKPNEKNSIAPLHDRLMNFIQEAESLNLDIESEWTKEDTKRVIERLKVLGYIE